MKRLAMLFFLMSYLGVHLYAQKIDGFGGELSILSFKPNYRTWVSKTTGYEFFGGIASELDNLKPDDMELGFKYLHAVSYSRTTRMYVGLVGKWKWVNGFDSNRKTSLPVPGVLIGKEFYDKRVKRKGFAIEIGYQLGTKNYKIYSPENHLEIGKERFEEFPLILNLRYSIYQKRR